MKKIITAIVIILFPLLSEAEEVLLKTSNGDLHGTLELPESSVPYPVILIISGSGPTDRDGNTAMLPGKNNSLKMLTEALARKCIASLRYDKRGIGESATAGQSEEDLRFGMYIDDAKGWAKQLKSDKRFKSVSIMGHSEGSLIGMVAAFQAGADSYLSIAGPSLPAIDTIRTQLQKQLQPELFKQADPLLGELENGKMVEDFPEALKTIFRPSAQPYLISWNQYNPSKEIQKLTVPVLILQGSTDIQVSVEEAESLHEAKPDSRLEVIDGMNHVLKLVPLDQQKQIASYSDPSLAISPRLVEVVSKFIHGHELL
jgi:uncharacterized protein